MTSVGKLGMGRRLALLLASIAGALVLSAGMALAATVTCQVGVYCLGTKNAETIEGTANKDAIYARGGGDTVKGLGEMDYLYGQGGADRLFGGPSDDHLVGGAGDDALGGGGGVDKLYFGDGWGEDSITNETVSGAEVWFSGLPGVAPTTADLTVDLVSGAGPEASDAGGTNTINWDGSVIDTVQGGVGNDDITGNASNNKLYAGPGADTVYGGEGEDVLSVVDMFTGDTVHCGPGEDRVIYDVLYLMNATYSDVIYPDCENRIPRLSYPH